MIISNMIEYLKEQGLDYLINKVTCHVTIERNEKKNTLTKTFTKIKEDEYVCPNCGSIKVITYSNRTVKKRHALSPTASVEKVYIGVKIRRLKCKDCMHYFDEENPLESRGICTKETISLIIDYLQRKGHYYSDTASTFGISVNLVRNLVNDLIRIKRPKLPKVLGMDEVFFKGVKNKPFVVTLTDFRTCKLIGLVKDRYAKTLRSFFSTYTDEERAVVQAVTVDLNKTYITVAKEMFPNCIIACDVFHLKQTINEKITHKEAELRALKRKYYKKEFRSETSSNYKDYWDYYLLSHQKLLLCYNQENVPEEIYIKGLDPDSHTYGYKARKWTDVELLKRYNEIDSELATIYEHKERFCTFIDTDYYKEFNLRNNMNPHEARKIIEEKVRQDLNRVFFDMRYTGIEDLIKFSITLENHIDEIINCFLKFPRQYHDKKTGKFYHKNKRLNNSLTENQNNEIKRIINACGGKLRNKELTMKLVLLKLNETSIYKILGFKK